MHHKFFIAINRLIIRVIYWFISRRFPYSEMYPLNCELKRVSAEPIPGTRQGLNWISVPNKHRKERSEFIEVIDTLPHYSRSWNLDSFKNFSKFLDLDLIIVWLSKKSSNLKIIKSICRYSMSEEFSRIISNTLLLYRKDWPKRFQLLVQLKIKNFVY